jgi:hypothetical protein
VKRLISSILVAGMAVLGLAVTGGSAYAAPAATTLIMSGGNGVYDLGPVVINGTASAAGTVEFTVNGKVVAGCEAVATATVTPFVASVHGFQQSLASLLSLESSLPQMRRILQLRFLIP